ncbi:aromatic ring-hydroxylating oxygenase subunit alpha [Mycobacterium heidelbergense]|uniref:aromatic ring-hydroxylating oxygenase subunit alpha n=1 Tax=Mycobacterium heidelbergense TaxID=53376 RepID=UPI003CF2C71D
MTDSGTNGAAAADELTGPVTIPVEAYVSEEYVRAERDKLWRKVWQQVGRVEDLPKVGSYLTYDILDDSIVVVRTGPDTLAAHHNVCMHRGRRLVDVPPGAKSACGQKKSFVCGFHGWTYDRDGTCIHIPEQQDWQGALTPENTHLAKVNVDTWGGWIWINMDPGCEPLRGYLEPAATMLDPFGLQDMRCKWRKWLHFECNWKVAMEAFNETYHVATTHPQFNKFGNFRGWAMAQGKHSNIGYDAPAELEETKSKIRLGTGADPRVSTAEMQIYTLEETNATTTRTLVEAARRLVDELPEDAPAGAVLEHWLSSARRDDAARGVVWPTIDPEHLARSGTAWQIFPNFQIGQGLTTALCYSARPHGYDPDHCIFEASCYELYPKGEEPQTEWVYAPPDDPNWRSVLPQDFSNMAAVQQGMKSLGFRGPKPNPYMERSTANLHRNLAEYMGSGAPRELAPQTEREMDR